MTMLIDNTPTTVGQAHTCFTTVGVNPSYTDFHRLGISLLLLFVLVFTAGTAQAHSTKGRIKVPLEKETIGVDDVAYFIESHVHKRMYSDNTESTKDRFVVSEFIGLTRNASKADVRFIVLDKRTNDTFEGAITLERGENGVWCFPGGNGLEAMDVTTYVPKGAYYWEKYSVGISVSGIFFCLCILVYSIYQRKLERSLDGDTDNDADGNVKGEVNGAV